MHSMHAYMMPMRLWCNSFTDNEHNDNLWY